MSAIGAQRGFGNRRGKREVIDVPERKTEDRSLDKLLSVRKQRLERLERERSEARNAWRKSRTDLRAAKERWRVADQEAKDHWRRAREEYFRMATTTGEFNKAKGAYDRMKREAKEMRLVCGEFVKRCKAARTGFFEARRHAIEANKQQEKLGILRDEMRLLNQQSEM
jgi:hypothetical protein